MMKLLTNIVILWLTLLLMSRYFILKVLSYRADKTLFPELHKDLDHLVKMAFAIYCTIRMNHLAKTDTEKLKKRFC